MTNEDPNVPNNYSAWKTAWGLTKPYFVSRGSWRAWLLVVAILALIVGGTAVDVEFSNWGRRFFSAAQELNKKAFLRECFLFPVMVLLVIVPSMLESFAEQALRLRWRQWMTGRVITLWLDGQSYYRLRWTSAGTDNPDQRISEDIASFIDKTVSISTSLVGAVLGLGSFSFILWRLSGALDMTLPHVGHVHIPASLFFGVLIYALVGTFLVHRVGRALVAIDFNQERREADFRFALVRVRENAENIALYGGERVERHVLDTRFAALVDNTWRLIRRRVALGFTRNVYNNAATIVPWIFMAPRFFAGIIKFGDVQQAGSAFSHVQRNLSVLVDNYADIAAWRATVRRIAGFAVAMREIRSATPEEAPTSVRLTLLAGGAELPPNLTPKLDLATSEDGGLHIVNVATQSPKGERIGLHWNFDVAPRDRVLLRGPSGCGKTTLLRAITGIWPYGSGRIEKPDKKTLVLSQRPYLPLGTLRDAVCYPRQSNTVDLGAVKQALGDVRMNKLEPKLDEVAEWSHILSLGEQQRIAFARVLLSEPDVIILDEATSALDIPAERQLYELICSKLPQAMILSVGHRDTLQVLHKREISVGLSEERSDAFPRSVAARPVS